MSKKSGLLAIFFIAVLVGLTLVTVYGAGKTDRLLAPAAEASAEFDYEQAAEIKGFRWNAMAEAYERRGLLNNASSPDEAMAYRWIAMARFYEKNDLLNELREHSDDSVAFRWVAMAQFYEKNDMLTRDPDLGEPSTLTVASQSQ